MREKLVCWLLWVDDCLILGDKDLVEKSKDAMKELFECDDLGEMHEYVGCKIERNLDERWVKLTQPVMLQSFQDEFELDEHRRNPRTPAEAGDVLEKGPDEKLMPKTEQKKYRSGVGKLLHMMRWTRPEIHNRVRELSRFMSGATSEHMAAMKKTMKYCVSTPMRGLKLNPTDVWDGTREFKFKVKGKSDSEYAKDLTRKSVNGWSVWLCNAPVSHKSKMMPIVALSVTEAELFAATQCAMDMLFVMRVLNSIGLQVELPMILEIDNRGAKDLTCNWAVGGRTRHVEVKQYFLRELRERGLIECRWCSGDKMTADIFTKNLAGPLFDKHAQSFVGYDDYMKMKGDVEWIEELDHSVTREGRVSEDDRASGREPGSETCMGTNDVGLDSEVQPIGRESSVNKDYNNYGSKNQDGTEIGETEVSGVVIGTCGEIDWEYMKVWNEIVVVE
jgi:hypothetical protein